MKIIKIKTLFVVFSIFSVVFVNAQPIGYYNGTEGKSGDELKNTLHDIIKDHVDFTYNQAKYLINYSDADPENPANVILFYSQISRDASLYGSVAGTINREHVWAKSHGNFAGIRPMDGDVLNLRPADAIVNMNRGNLDFDNVQPNGVRDPLATNCWYSLSAYEPGPLTKGQVARILFYMATRYEGTDGELDLELVPKTKNYPEPKFGNLTTLLEWNKQYPPSDMERQRNDRIFRMQQNRNPFVDHPEFADYIWANGSPSGVKFGNFKMNPEFPFPGDDIQISLTVKNSTDTTAVSIFWGNEFDSETHQLKMENSGDNYTANLSLSGYSAGDQINFKVQVSSGNDEKTYFRANYLLPEKLESIQLTPISAVQGTDTSSPMENKKVTVSGRVTANFDNSFYIQSGNDKRSGINVYNSLFTGKNGDSLVVTGFPTEYSGLTELTNVSYTYNFKSQKTIEPIILKASQLNEDYEGMLVQINDVKFETPGIYIQDQNTNYLASDETGNINVYISWTSRLVSKNIPGGTINLVGIVSQYKDTYQILPRDINDFRVNTSVKTLQKVVTDNLIVYPSPASELLNIKTEKTLSTIKITNYSGQELINCHQTSRQLNIRDLNPGIYIIEVVFQDNSRSRTRFCKYN